MAANFEAGRVAIGRLGLGINTHETEHEKQGGRSKFRKFPHRITSALC